ncbi:hypothetical protein GON09_005453 [Rhodococcus sp. B50]|nr:hypothetical protein [Rhodococcus sp. B50]
MTSQIAAAKRNDPGLWTVLDNTNFCGGVLRGIKTADRESEIVVNDCCVDPSISSSIPGGFEGVQVGTTANLDPATEDMKLFQAAIDKYEPGLRIEANAAGGWQPVLGLALALNAGEGEVTKESVAEGLRSAPALPYPADRRCAVPVQRSGIPTLTQRLRLRDHRGHGGQGRNARRLPDPGAGHRLVRPAVQLSRAGPARGRDRLSRLCRRPGRRA